MRRLHVVPSPRRLRLAALSTLLLATACYSVEMRFEPCDVVEPSIEQLGGVHLAITTGAPRAQRWFDLGLAWSYAYHDAEALRCFEAAVAADPGCAMAWWGIAHASWTHVDHVMLDPDVAARPERAARRSRALRRRSREAVRHAVLSAPRATTLEQGLIAAVARRDAAGGEGRSAERVYADAMRRVHERHRDDADVGVLFAASLMALQTDGSWTAAGDPEAGTAEVLAVLEHVLRVHPDHPGAHHLYIHALEASPHPERALPSAERLLDLAPAAGHLVHMPAHVFLRVGRYADAVAASRRAIEADLRTVARTGRNGFYDLCRAHAYHVLAHAAMFAGRADDALAAADDLLAVLPTHVVRAHPASFESLLALPVHVRIRFGLWQELLELPAPPAWQKSVRTVWHYGRGIALAALGRVDEAQHEQRAFVAAGAEVPEHWMTGVNPTRDVLAVGEALLAGEVTFREGRHDEALAQLHEAARRADALRYDEPAGWMMPPRHALGALLLEAGRAREAAAVYRNDLQRHPDNGWALHGLAESLRRIGADVEARAVERRFENVWADATVRIGASCLCRADAD